MKMTVRLLVVSLACAALTAAVGCSPSIEVHSLSFPTTHFAQYQTFTFDTAADAPAEYEASAHSKDVQRRVRLLVASFLEGRGYVQKAEGEADFVVQVASGRRQRTVTQALSLMPRPRPAGPAWFEEHETKEFVEGILVIDVLDGKKEEVLWHGAAQVEIDSSKVDDALLTRVTNEALAAFPWSRVKPAPQ